MKNLVPTFRYQLTHQLTHQLNRRLSCRLSQVNNFGDVFFHCDFAIFTFRADTFDCFSLASSAFSIWSERDANDRFRFSTSVFEFYDLEPAAVLLLYNTTVAGGSCWFCMPC